MKFTIKSLSTSKGKIRNEIHCFGCKDIWKDNPIQVNELEAFSAEEMIRRDIGSEYEE
jgi:hypothetical protein